MFTHTHTHTHTQRRIGATDDDSDYSSEDGLEGEEMHIEGRDSDSDEEGGDRSRRVKYK